MKPSLFLSQLEDKGWRITKEPIHTIHSKTRKIRFEID